MELEGANTMRQATAPLLPYVTESVDLTKAYVAKAGFERAALPTKVIEIISLFDGHRSVREVCDACQISEEKGLAIVRKLASMGILHTPRPTVETRTFLSGSGFTAEEEAFFSAELSPIDECDEPFPPTISERINLFICELILRLKGSPAL
jgi:hypothetical protein